MNALFDFFSPEAGQRRRAALNEFGRDIGYYVPPELRGILGLVAEATPTATIDRASAASMRAADPTRTASQRIGDVGNMLSEVAGVVAPAAVASRAAMPVAQALQEGLLGFSVGAQDAGRAIVDRLNQPGPVPTMYSNPIFGAVDNPAGVPDDSLPTLMDALRARAEEMQLGPRDRIQPLPGGTGIIDRDYMTPAPGNTFDDLALAYPRNPDPSAPLPKGDRARILVDRQEEIASALADRIRATGQMDADTRYFYHTDGPIYRAARNAGLSDEEARAYLRDLSNYTAATSPRTQVETNLRNATLAMAKTDQGIPFREVIGPGSGGINESGYAMMTNPGGIHGILLDDLINTGVINTNTNPKPANFGANLAGNRSGVTVDTHAIRGTLMTLNEMQPGSVPEGFIIPSFRDQYRANPNILTPDMIDDTLASQMVGPAGDRVKMQTEYPVFADIWHGAADRLGVSPAEAQSMGWFGFGDETNLGSARKTPVDVFDDRLSVTAQTLGISPEEAARAVFTRRIPLLSAVPGLLAYGAMQPEQEQN